MDALQHPQSYCKSFACGLNGFVPSPPQIPIVSFPTPERQDRLIYEVEDYNKADTNPPIYGSPHPNSREFPNHYFVFQKPTDNFEWMVRYYATDRTNENWYNASISYLDESNANPVFTRDYLLRRTTYQATGPTTKLSTLTALVNLRVTAGGSGYPEAGTTATFSGGTGSGGAATPIVYRGVVIALLLTAEGSYTVAPNITIAGTGGSGATAAAAIQPVTALLVSEEEQRQPDQPTDSLFVLVRRVYMTLPGPWVYSRKALEGGKFLEIKQRDVVSSTYPTPRSSSPSAETVGKTSVLSKEIIHTYVNSSGETTTTPIYIRADYISELSVFRYTHKQMMDTPATPLLPNTAAGSQDAVFAGSQVTAVNSTLAGSAYGHIPYVIIQPTNMGQQATATARMRANAFVAFTTAGTGYLVNDVLTLTGGTFVTAATVTVTAVGLNSTAVNAAGTGYTDLDTITLAGGTFSVAAVVRPVTLKLVTVTASAAGTGYNIGDTINLIDGVYSQQGVVTVATVKFTGLSALAYGSGYATADTVTLAGGTFSTATIVTLASTRFVSGTFNGGSGYSIGDVLTLTSGTYSTAATIQVTTLQLLTTSWQSRGSNYATSDTITLGLGSIITAAVVTVASVVLVGGTILNGGSGYATSDLIVTSGGTGTQATLLVTSVSGGAVTSYSIQSIGNWTTSTGTLTQGATTGGGTGFQLTASYGVNTVTVTTTGEYANAQTGFTQTSTSGSGSGAQFAFSSWRPKSFSVGNGGVFTVNSGTQTLTGGTGAGGTMNSVLYGVGTFSPTTAGNYSVTTTTYTQGATSGGGTGATFNTGVYGILTLTVSTPGVFTHTVAAPQQGTTSGSGTGATFAALYGLLTVIPTTAGSYTVPPASFTQGSTTGGGTGATFNTTTFGAGSGTLTTQGSTYSVLPNIAITAISIKRRGVGHAVGDVLTLVGGSGTAPTLTVTAILGTEDTGPISTVQITTAGEMTAVPSGAAPTSGTFTSTSSGDGAGAEFNSATYRSISAVSGGAGTGAKVALGYEVHNYAVSFGGTNYFGAPSVNVEGPATATATIGALGNGGILDAATYVTRSWTEPIENTDKDWLFWVSMPIPPTRTTHTSVPFTKPGFFAIKFDIVNNPPWPGYDFTATAPMTGEFKGTQTLTYKLGQWDDLPDTFSTDSPAAVSRYFPNITSRTIHNAFSASDGQYSETFPASTQTGYDATTGYIARSEQRNIDGEFWVKDVTVVPP